MKRALTTCGLLVLLLGWSPSAGAGDDPATRRGDQQSTPDRGHSGTQVGTAVPRQPSPTPAPPAASQPKPAPAPQPTQNNVEKSPDSRPRNGTPVGVAVQRTSPPHTQDRHHDHDDGSHAAYGYGVSGYYGSYSGAYDPWYGWYPPPGPVYAPGPFIDAGAVRLKVKPVEAEVYVDGYYAGIVDDFDGVFQKLRLEAGPHRIEIRAPGFATLDVDIRIEPDHTTTYRGTLQTVR